MRSGGEIRLGRLESLQGSSCDIQDESMSWWKLRMCQTRMFHFPWLLCLALSAFCDPCLANLREFFLSMPILALDCLEFTMLWKWLTLPIYFFRFFACPEPIGQWSNLLLANEQRRVKETSTPGPWCCWRPWMNNWPTGKGSSPTTPHWSRRGGGGCRCRW